MASRADGESALAQHIADAVVLAREVADVLEARWPAPTGTLELALLVVASGMARESDKPLSSEHFAMLAQLAYDNTRSGPRTPTSEQRARAGAS